jgi:thiol-disulfide isomerase/thioredoxin
MPVDDALMMTPRRPGRLVLGIVTAVAVAACSGASGDPPGASVEPARSVEPVAEASGASSAAAAGTVDRPWANAQLVDVSTGESFRIADFSGSVVIVETMAIWCPNCRSQQRAVEAALATLPADDVVYVVLDVDPNEDASSLAAYREQNGFHGRYAIAGSEVARALAAEFGDQFLNPPSTPIAVIGTDGSVTRAAFGQKSADEIAALARAAGA